MTKHHGIISRTSPSVTRLPSSTDSHSKPANLLSSEHFSPRQRAVGETARVSQGSVAAGPKAPPTQHLAIATLCCRVGTIFISPLPLPLSTELYALRSDKSAEILRKKRIHQHERNGTGIIPPSAQHGDFHRSSNLFRRHTDNHQSQRERFLSRDELQDPVIMVGVVTEFRCGLRWLRGHLFGRE